MISREKFYATDMYQNMMSHSFDTKEEIVTDFVRTVSEISEKPCNETENDMQQIIYRVRGLIHNDPKRSFKKSSS